MSKKQIGDSGQNPITESGYMALKREAEQSKIFNDESEDSNDELEVNIEDRETAEGKEMEPNSTKINYGIDAPGLVKAFFILGSLAAIALILLIFLLSSIFATFVSVLAFIIMIYCLAMGSFMMFYSSIVKIKDREKLLDLVSWKGNEIILDVGCGRGLMLIGAAKRVNTGKAVGIDIWQQQDQSNNSAIGTLQNAKLEGVENRVEVKTADMRDLPFQNETFDVVTSAWAVHNLETKVDRQKAIEEILRVLKPNGVLILADISNQEEYEEHFRQKGLKEIRRHNYVSGLGLLRAVSFGSFAPSATFIRKN
jgi:SAM-dependent methyltransferase